MQRPQHKEDLIASLRDHPGWRALKEEFEKRIKDQLDQICVAQLHDQKSIGKHNVSVGKVAAWREVLDFPEEVSKRASTVTHS